MMRAKAVGYMKPNIDPNTRLYVPFNEGIGEVAKDYSQYGNHAVLTDVEWGIGLNGNAGVFDGVTSIGNCGLGVSGSFDITDAITIKAGLKWVGNASGDFGYVVHKNANLQWLVSLNQIGTENQYNINVGGVLASDVIIFDFTDAQQHYSVNIYQEGSKQMWIDAVKKDEQVDTGVISTTVNNLLLGGRTEDNLRNFNGTIAPVIIRALAESAAQVAADCYEVVCN